MHFALNLCDRYLHPNIYILFGGRLFNFKIRRHNILAAFDVGLGTKPNTKKKIYIMKITNNHLFCVSAAFGFLFSSNRFGFLFFGFLNLLMVNLDVFFFRYYIFIIMNIVGLVGQKKEKKHCTCTRRHDNARNKTDRESQPKCAFFLLIFIVIIGIIIIFKCVYIYF